MKSPFQLTLMTGTAIAIALSSVVLRPAQTSAQTSTQPSVRVAQRAPVVYVRREVSGSAPGGRYKGGGSRSVNLSTAGKEPLCPTTTVPLTALVPFEETYEKGRENLLPIVNVWGYTTSDRPTFWVYVPYSNPAIPARFVLDDDTAQTTIYQTSVTLPGKAGIVGLSLPQDAPRLQPGKRYRWFFSLNCQDSSTGTAGTDNPQLEAVVIREAAPAELTKQLTATPSLQNAIAYAKAGYWYDALSTLAVLRQQRPQDEATRAAWRELLSGMASDNLSKTAEKSRQNFNLDAISTQPIVN